MYLKKNKGYLTTVCFTIVIIMVCLIIFLGSKLMDIRFSQKQLGKQMNLFSEETITILNEGAETEQIVGIEQVGIETSNKNPSNRTIYSTIVNNTDYEIIGYELGMLAFDNDGNPLDIYWIGIDSSIPHSFYHLYIASDKSILPGEKIAPNNWSLLNMHEGEEYSKYDKIAYVIYNFKKISLKDKGVWENPDYESWLNIYKQQKIEIKNLREYYPHNQIISLKNFDVNVTVCIF